MRWQNDIKPNPMKVYINHWLRVQIKPQKTTCSIKNIALSFSFLTTSDSPWSLSPSSVSSMAGNRAQWWCGSWVEPKLGALPTIGAQQPGTRRPDPGLRLPSLAGSVSWGACSSRRGLSEREGGHQTAHWTASTQTPPALRKLPGPEGKNGLDHCLWLFIVYLPTVNTEWLQNNM